MIETGTWYGDGVQAGLANGLSVESCEINDKFVMIARDRFSTYKNVEIYQLLSDSFLKLSSDVPAVYWLDAHLPELYVRGGLKIYSEAESAPLENELRIILRKKNIHKSIIVIDDVRLYENHEYENKDIEQKVSFQLRNFLLAEFSGHCLYFSLSDEGYFVLIPKSYVGHEHFFREPGFCKVVDNP